MNGQMEEVMKENGIIITCTDMESTNGEMGENTKVII